MVETVRSRYWKEWLRFKLLTLVDEMRRWSESTLKIYHLFSHNSGSHCQADCHQLTIYIIIHVRTIIQYLIDHFQGQWNTIMTEQNIQSITTVKNPNWPEANQLAIYKTSTAEKLNKGLPGTNSTSGQNVELEPRIPGFQGKRPNHWACTASIYMYFTTKHNLKHGIQYKLNQGLGGKWGFEI